MRNHRDRVLQPVLTQPCRAKEPEERAQRRRRKLHRPWLVTARERADKAVHVARVNPRDLNRAAAARPLQKRPGEPRVVASCPRT